MLNRKYFQRNLQLLSTKELYFASEIALDILDASEEQAESTYNLDVITLQHIVLLANEQNLEKILEAERRNDIYHGMIKEKLHLQMLPFYLYYDEEQFALMLSQNDISRLCEHYRIVIIVGKSSLRNFFVEMDTLMPSLVLGNEKQILIHELQLIQIEKSRILDKAVKDVSSFYEKEELNIRNRILAGNPKVCILKNYFEPPRFKALYQQMKTALEQFNCQVEICNERGPVFRTIDIIRINQYRPDIIFQINKSRNGRTYQGEVLHLENLEQLFFVNWIQDIHPAVLNKEYAISLQKNDYVFTLFDAPVMEHYGFKKRNVIYGGIMPADKRHFYVRSLSEQEHKYYDCDICFIGSIMTEESVVHFIYNTLRPYLSEKQIEKVADSLFVMLEKMYDPNTGTYHVSVEGLNENVDSLQNELKLSEEARLNVYRVFSVVRYNSFRKLILLQLAARKKYKITLYGANDIGIQGVAYGGFINDPDELSKAIQCSKLAMQINPDATMNQRVAECLLSHTMVLVFQVMEQSDMSSIKQYLDVEEGICYFSNKYELFDKCDILLKNNDKRKSIAERGYHKASKTLSTDAIFTKFLENLSYKAGC